MRQPFVIAQGSGANKYLSSSFHRSWESAKVATWVPCGAWRDEVFIIEDRAEAQKFAVEVREKTGINVEVVCKWPESIEEILHTLGVAPEKSHDSGTLRGVVGQLWLMLEWYPAHLQNKVTS